MTLRMTWCARTILLAALALGVTGGGCLHFQTGPSKALPPGEAVTVAGRGQLRVLDLHPDAAETVLLVHGYGASSASYRPVLTTLAARYRVLAVDLPGFGKSDKRAGDYSPEALADVLARILDEKGVTRAHVVGHSWGCSVVLAFALRHPDRLARLALVSGFVFDDQLLPMFRWARASEGVGRVLYAAIYPQALGERMYLNFYDPYQLTEETVEEVEKNLGEPGALAAALAAARGMHLDVLERGYATVRAPTLLLWGAEDRVARLQFGERLARLLPHAELRVIGQCGHIPMWECTGETAAALLRHFAGGAP